MADLLVGRHTWNKVYPFDLSIAGRNQKVTSGSIEQCGVVSSCQDYIWTRLLCLGQTGDNFKLSQETGLSGISLWLIAFV
jgi:hypothetical protein